MKTRTQSRAYPYPIGPDAAYAVNLWGSRPGTDDDCWTADYFVTHAEAVAAFKEALHTLESGGRFWGEDNTSTAYVELDGPDAHDEQRVKSFRPTPDNDNDWQREQAMQAGMGLGIDAYNDVYGY